jgi:hypothetical protein
MNDTHSAALAVRSTAEIATPRARRYLTQLCKHFEHERPVTYDEQTGQIAFTIGECRLRADDGVLTLSLQAADAAAMAQLQDVVARHLLRFAFREEMQIDWRAA